jgi:hypothetical protein
MKILVSFLKIFVLIVITTLGGCVAGYALGSLGKDPADVRWEQIPDPPEKPVRIIQIGGYGRDAKSLFIDAVSGRQYECCGLWPMAWKEAVSKRTRVGDACPSLQESPLDQVPGKVVDCAYVMQWEWATEKHYVVLLEDGSLWRWRFYKGMDVLFRSIVWGALVGFVVGIVILLNARRRQNA